MPEPVSVSRTILIALIRLWRFKKDLIVRLAFPVAATVLLTTMAAMDELTLSRILVLSILSLPLYTLIGITCHRTLLLGVETVPIHGLYWSRRESRFLLYALAVTIGLGIAGVVFGLLGVAILGFFAQTPDRAEAAIGSVALGCGGTAMLLAMARLSFLFPAIALDRKGNIRQSHAETRGNTLRIFVLLLFPLTLGFLLSLIVHYLTAPLGSIVEYIGAFLTFFFQASFPVAVISIAYRDVILANDG